MIPVHIKDIRRHNQSVHIIAKAAVQRYLDLYDGERTEVYPHETLEVEASLRLLHTEGLLLDSDLPTHWGGRA